jgi:hypothetical protein
MRTWTRLIPTALLTLPLLLPSVHAADPELDSVKIRQLQDDVKQLRKDLDALRDAIRRIDQRTEIMQRESFYGPSGAIGNGVAPRRATITMQNDSAVGVTVRINGMPYRVEPFSTRPLTNVPVGPFNYEIEADGFGILEPVRTETLTPNGHRFRIYPR